RPYNSKDYSRVLTFLKKFNSEIVDGEWEKILEYKWENKTGLVGMLLESENEIVGFISYIMHSITVNDLDYTHCNISSWVVNPEFRAKSLQLLSPLFNIKNCTIINISPHENTLPVFKALRFDILSEYEFVINPFKLKMHSLLAKGKGVNAEEIVFQNIDTIDPKIRKIVEDHKFYKNVVFYKFYFKRNGVGENLILAFNKKKFEINSGTINILKELPYKLLNYSYQYELLYSSSNTTLSENITDVLLSFVKKASVRSITISDCFFNGKQMNLKYMSKNKKSRPWFVYSDNQINYSEINVLYSEKVLLNF